MAGRNEAFNLRRKQPGIGGGNPEERRRLLRRRYAGAGRRLRQFPHLDEQGAEVAVVADDGHHCRPAGDEVGHGVGGNRQVGGVLGAVVAEVLDAAHPEPQPRVFGFRPQLPQFHLVGAHIQGQAAQGRVFGRPAGDNLPHHIVGAGSVLQVFGVHINGGGGGERRRGNGGNLGRRAGRGNGKAAAAVAVSISVAVEISVGGHRKHPLAAVVGRHQQQHHRQQQQRQRQRQNSWL